MAHVGYLYITEYQRLGQAHMDTVQAPQTPPLRRQFVTVHDDESHRSSPFGSDTAFVRIWASHGPVWLDWGPDAVAKVGYDPLVASSDFAVAPGHRVAVIAGEHKT